MTDSAAEPDAFAGMAAEHPLMAAGADQDSRRNRIRRTIAVAAVIVVHFLAILLIAYSNKLPAIEKIRVTMPEAIAWIPIAQPAAHPLRRIEGPQDQTEPFPQITAPITLPPVRHKELEPPAPGGIEGVGRALACGASSYENLPAAERERCYRRPWAYVKRPDGTIVLDVPKTEPPPTTADIIRHEQQIAPPCPVLSNVPCLGKVIHGDQPF
ncbi:MAG TPA: hypothetical protein VGB91_06525 [Rhizomicrobium sp.]